MDGFVTRLWHGVGEAIQLRRLRRDLAHLDDRMLQDLGISRAQAAFEADRLVPRRHGTQHPKP